MITKIESLLEHEFQTVNLFKISGLFSYTDSVSKKANPIAPIFVKKVDLKLPTIEVEEIGKKKYLNGYNTSQGMDIEFYGATDFELYNNFSRWMGLIVPAVTGGTKRLKGLWLSTLKEGTTDQYTFTPQFQDSFTVEYLSIDYSKNSFSITDLVKQLSNGTYDLESRLKVNKTFTISGAFPLSMSDPEFDEDTGDPLTFTVNFTVDKIVF